MRLGRTSSTSLPTPSRSRTSSSWCSKRLVAERRRSRFAVVSPSGPKKSRRMLLSSPCTAHPSRSRVATISEPTRPLEPVTRAVLGVRLTFASRGSRPGLEAERAAIPRLEALVVPPAQVPLEKDVQDDEGIATAHLVQRELRLALLAIAPGDRDDGIAVASHDRLQRDLDREVEVVREQRLNGLDHLAPIRLERVRRVVVAASKEDPDPPVGHAIEHELDPRVVVDRRAADEARSERAVVAVRDHAEVADEILGIVGAVGHHDRDSLALEDVEPRTHGETEAGRVVREVIPDAWVVAC